MPKVVVAHRLGFVAGDLVGGAVATAHGELIDAGVRDLSVILDRAKERAGAIEADRNLTKMGKLDARRKAAAEAHGAITQASARRRPALEQAISKARDQLPSALRPPISTQAAHPETIGHVFNQHEAANRVSEIRSKLENMDPVARTEVLRTAGVNGDRATLYAANSFSAWERAQLSISDEDLDEALQAAARAENPAAAERLGVAQSALRIYDSNGETARQAVAKALGVLNHEQ
jgi:hypothetical protein